MNSPLSQGAAELIARRFWALSDPTRLRLIDLLRERKEASVGELAAALDSSQQNASKHLAALYAEGFLARRKQGTSSLYWIADQGVLDLCERVCAGIETQLAELDAVISGRA